MRQRRLFGPSVLVATAAVLLLAPTASAMTTQWTMAFWDTVTNPCTHEEVLITGSWHMVAVSNGNKAEVQTNWPDTSGVSLTTGTRYKANTTVHAYVFSGGPNFGTFTVADSYELVSQDGTSNFLVHEEVQFDLSTGGDPIFTRGGTECSGPTPAPPPEPL